MKKNKFERKEERGKGYMYIMMAEVSTDGILFAQKNKCMCTHRLYLLR